MASGRPVIAFRGGGALETVIEKETGLFFDKQEPSSLAETIKKFKDILRKEGIEVTQRYKFGQDIKAACGQLAGK